VIIAALILPAVLGFTALAVEGGLWYADQHQLRNMVDTAALAAGWARKDGADELEEAIASVGEMGYDADLDEIVVISPPESGVYEGDEKAIEIVAVRTRPLRLAALFMDDTDVDIRARAVVRFDEAPGAPVCLLALRPTGQGYTGTGTSEAMLENCGVHVNSQSGGALTMTGGAIVGADFVHVGGTITTSGHPEIISEDIETGADIVPDPYADMEFPGAGTCNHTNYSTTTSATLNPGRYCGGIQVTSQANITLNPGVYIIDKGSFSLSGQTTLTGNGVTIILTGSGTDWASASFAGGTTVDLKAPTTGEYAGMVLMKDRLATSGSVSLTGGSAMKLHGAVYVPTHGISYTGGSDQDNGCTQIVAYAITLVGNSNLSGECPDFELATIGSADGAPGLVE
jgi:hypothetical protein